MGMSFSLGAKSRENLKGVHADLIKVVEKAITTTTQDFTVGEGVRSLERQKRLVASGASRTMNSRHLTGHAVDLHPHPYKGDHDVDGIPNSDDWDAYKPIYEAMKQAAKDLDIEMEHGWDWGWDAPHHQLSAKVYK
jgi:peptidoglycan L-alanyl-D-glutamate endopeptidase CwlK